MSIHLCHLGSEDDARECTRCGITLYGGQFGCADTSRCLSYQRARAEKAEKVLADIATKAAPYARPIES